MKIGFLIYGSLDTVSGGYLYDRKLVEYLRGRGDTVEVISLPWRNYAAHLTDNLWFRLPSDLDILIQDELNHPSLIAANLEKHPYPIISLVHHLRCSELRPKWQNDFYRVVEKKYLESVDGFIFNSQTTQRAVNHLIGNGKPAIVAYPPTDRFGAPISEEEIKARAVQNQLQILFLGNVIQRKGLHTLLQAISSFSSRTSQKLAFRLDVIGSLTSEPGYAKKMQEYVANNNLASLVTFYSTLDNEFLKQKLQKAHILIVPSSYEGFGIVYLEGMGFGLPGIGTTAGAASEIIADNETGFLIEPNDSATLAQCISALAQDRALLTRLSINARKRHLEQPAWIDTASRIRAYLQNMIE